MHVPNALLVPVAVAVAVKRMDGRGWSESRAALRLDRTPQQLRAPAKSDRKATCQSLACLSRRRLRGKGGSNLQELWEPGPCWGHSRVAAVFADLFSGAAGKRPPSGRLPSPASARRFISEARWLGMPISGRVAGFGMSGVWAYWLTGWLGFATSPRSCAARSSAPIRALLLDPHPHGSFRAGICAQWFEPRRSGSGAANFRANGAIHPGHSAPLSTPRFLA